MSLNKFSAMLMGLCIIALSTSCTYRLGDLTVMSTKNIELSKMGMYKKCAERSIGEDKVYVIFFIPVGMPSIEEACDRAIESAGGTFLTDAVVTYESFIFFFGWMKYEVEGEVWCQTSGPSDTSINIPDYVLENSSKGSQISVCIPGDQVVSGELIAWGKNIIILSDDAGNLHTIPRSEILQVSLPELAS